MLTTTTVELADNDRILAVTAVTSSNHLDMIGGAVMHPLVSTTMNKLVDDDSLIDADDIIFDIDEDGTLLNNGTTSFHEIRSYALSVLKMCDDAGKKREASTRGRKSKKLDITK